MKTLFAILLLVFMLWNSAIPSLGNRWPTEQSDCSTISVEAPENIDSRELIFKVKIAGGKKETLTYKWSAYGGEIKTGQGTTSVTIVNFDLRRKSVTVVVELGGQPAKCESKTASCTISVLGARRTSACSGRG